MRKKHRQKTWRYLLEGVSLVIQYINQYKCRWWTEQLALFLHVSIHPHFATLSLQGNCTCSAISSLFQMAYFAQRNEVEIAMCPFWPGLSETNHRSACLPYLCNCHEQNMPCLAPSSRRKRVEPPGWPTELQREARLSQPPSWGTWASQAPGNPWIHENE